MASASRSKSGKQQQVAGSGKGEIMLYRTSKGGPAIKVCLEKETVWLNKRQMADLFDRDTDTIGLYIRKIFKEKELEKKATTEDLSVVQRAGGRSVRRSIRFYNLDMIISVATGSAMRSG